MNIDTGNTRGLVRKLDLQSRIVIPVEFRKQLGVKENGEFEIFLLADGIYLKKYKEG